jgi:cytochrome P450
MKDDMIGSYQAKIGDIMIIPTYATQRLAKYWVDPEGFDPTRFLHPLTPDQRSLYLPFALGEHSCIGAQYATMQIALILAMLTRRFRLELTPGCSLARQSGWGRFHNRMNIQITMRIRKV